MEIVRHMTGPSSRFPPKILSCDLLTREKEQRTRLQDTASSEFCSFSRGSRSHDSVFFREIVPICEDVPIYCKSDTKVRVNTTEHDDKGSKWVALFETGRRHIDEQTMWQNKLLLRASSSFGERPFQLNRRLFYLFQSGGGDGSSLPNQERTS